MERFDERQIRYAGTELRRLIDATAIKAQRVSQVSSPSAKNCKTKYLMAFPALGSDPSYQIGHTTSGRVGLDLHIITYHLRPFMPRSTCLHRSVARTRSQHLPLPAYDKQIG